MKKTRLVKQTPEVATADRKTSRIPGFYRLSVEQRLAFLARTFNLSDDQIAQLRDGSALKIEHAVNMVENTIGVFGLPLGLGLNFVVDGREYLVPMAIEEASIIAAVSKGALLIRQVGGFETTIDDPVMIGQIQVLDIAEMDRAVGLMRECKQEILEIANSADAKMCERGGGVKDIETRIVDGGSIGPMLIVHLLVDVCEAMGANAVNSICEAVGPKIQDLTGGRVNLRILSNYADRRIARSRFRLPFDSLSTESLAGSFVAERMVEASKFAEVDPYRAATHNKGIFNGICAAALAFGQDWRAIEAGGHVYAASGGQYKGLATYRIEDNSLVGELELPLQVGWVGGAVNSHPGVRILRAISGVQNSRELSGLLASVGLAQNFAACLALCTDGIQRGHMALHARSVAISVGVPSEDIDKVAQEMIRKGDVKVSAAEEILKRMRSRVPRVSATELALPVEAFAKGKVILFGEHATVYGYPGIISAIDLGLTVRIKKDSDGPRFLNPHFRQAFPVPTSDSDVRLFSRAANAAIESYGLKNEQIAIEVESKLVPGMGLGSSASFSVALCKALRKYKGNQWDTQWDTELFEDAQKLEAIFHGNPSGMDAATVLSEGVIWFRKGPPREILPIRVPKPIAGLVAIVEPGARTVELVNKVSRFRERDRKAVDAIFEEIGSITVDAGIALGSGDEVACGRLMERNHSLLARLGVSTRALDSAVDSLLDNGALGAKLTGAGGGGAVVAIVDMDKQFEIMEKLSDEFALIYPFVLGAAR